MLGALVLNNSLFLPNQLANKELSETDAQLNLLVTRVEQLSAELNHRRFGTDRNNGPQQTERRSYIPPHLRCSPIPTRADPQRLCYYHANFSTKAYRCCLYQADGGHAQCQNIITTTLHTYGSSVKAVIIETYKAWSHNWSATALKGNRLLYINERTEERSYLIDTGAAISDVSPTSHDQKNLDATFSLRAPNGSEFNTYGEVLPFVNIFDDALL